MFVWHPIDRASGTSPKDDEVVWFMDSPQSNQPVQAYLVQDMHQELLDHHRTALLEYDEDVLD